MDWRKSSHSGANGGSCVEVVGTSHAVLVRDTKDRDGRMLAFSTEAWRAFAEELKRKLAPETGVWKDVALTMRRLEAFRPGQMDCRAPAAHDVN